MRNIREKSEIICERKPQKKIGILTLFVLLILVGFFIFGFSSHPVQANYQGNDNTKPQESGNNTTASGATRGYEFRPLSVPSLIASIASLLLGIYIINRNPRDTPSQVFTLLMGSCVLWGFGEAMMQSNTNLELALFWSKISNTGVIFLPIFLLHFVLISPRMRIKSLNSKLFLIILYLPSIFFLVLIYFTDMFFTIELKNNEVIYGTGLFYTIFFIFFFMYLIASVIILLLTYMNPLSDSEKNPSKYLTTGIILIMLLLLSDIILAMFFGELGILLDSIVILIIAAFFTAAVLKYDILEFHLIIEKSVAYVSITLIIVSLFIIVGQLLQDFVGRLISPDSQSPIPGIISALVVSFSFDPLKDKVQYLADKMFPVKSFETK